MDSEGQYNRMNRAQDARPEAIVLLEA